MTLKRALLYVGAGLIVLDLLLLLSGYRVLISERRENRVVVPGPVTEQVNERILVCTYFTGWSIQTSTTARAHPMDECPFLFHPRG